MPRISTLSLFLFTIGCATTDQTTMDSLPAPMFETARVDSTGSQAVQVARTMPSDLVFVPSDSIGHEWTDGGGRRMHVVFRLSVGLSAARTDTATEQMQTNWDFAVRQARLVVENADLTNDQGTERCERRLCEVLTKALFAGELASAGACVDRVVWKRLTWN